MADLLSELQGIMRDTFDDDALVITRRTTAAEVPDWDSLTHISLIVAVEKRFGVRFTHGEIEHLQDVGEFLDLLEAKTTA